MPAKLKLAPALVLNPSELATVLHGLRLIQEQADGPSDCTAAICEHFMDAEALTNPQIDALCERLNEPDPRPTAPLAQTYRASLEASELATTLAALRLFQRTYEGKEGREIAEAWPEHFNLVDPPEDDPDWVVEPPPLGTDDINTLCERLNCPPAPAPPAQVVIEISGGAANVTTCPDNVKVQIVDWDMFESGDHTITGENAVTEEYRAWLQANRPEWYASQLNREAEIMAEKLPPASTGIYCKAGELCLSCGMAHPPGEHIISPAVLKARAGLIPHDPQDDEPETETPDPEQAKIEAAYRAAANKYHASDGELEIDADAKVSIGDDPGAYVQAWVWVTNEEAGIPETAECSEEGCTTILHPEDPYYATPCGTYCSEHMREHVKGCEICRNEFPEIDATE
jgi:hypothetical protein